ncbi:membrane protein insertase YidC [Candidatus Saccharibacteria bacterium]|nr:membrane protein insertase YidC [Candidatus Saccharibacteria bacterium]
MNFFDVLIIQPIFNLLISLYAIIPGGDFGVSIIIFTVIVRFLMYPLTRSMLHQTRAMRKLQPELVKIKKRAGKNREQVAREQMELYKRNGINPFRPIGILLIQVPIFIALFSVIRIFTYHRDEISKFTYDFLENVSSIQKIIENPDSFNETFLGFIDLTQHAIHENGVEISILILAVISGITQYIMSKQTMPHQDSTKRFRDLMAEAAEGKQPDQAEMNAVMMRKMNKFLPILMFFVMISLPGALVLYYTVSNIVAVAQQAHLLRQDQDELEEITKQGIDKSTNKKATVKAREKQAKQAEVVRITAKDTKRRKK